MYNLIVLSSKPRDWEHDQFIEWWRGEHADLTRRIPGLVRWHHTEVLDTMGDERSAGWDGLSVLTFGSRDDLDAALSSPQWAAAVAHVGEMRGRRILVMGDEVTLFPLPDEQG